MSDGENRDGAGRVVDAVDDAVGAAACRAASLEFKAQRFAQAPGLGCAIGSAPGSRAGLCPRRSEPDAEVGGRVALGGGGAVQAALGALDRVLRALPVAALLALLWS
jgi:hypothetical protein